MKIKSDWLIFNFFDILIYFKIAHGELWEKDFQVESVI